MKYGEIRSITYGIPTQLKSPAFITTYIQLQVENVSDKTLEDVIVSLRYPSNSQIAETGSMRQDTFGDKQEKQLKRWTNTVEGVTFSYLSIDSLGPGKALILHEPINILPKTSSEVVINVDISAKDFWPREFGLQLYALPSDSLVELIRIHSSLIYREVVEHRKNMSVLAYLRESIRGRRIVVTEVFPSFQVASKSNNELGYLSDAMHDTWGSRSYKPAPLEYAFR
jgi:hypothetical protein